MTQLCYHAAMFEDFAGFIFDMDGTMVDNMEFHARSWHELFRSEAIPVDMDQVRTHMAGKTTATVLRSVIGAHLTDAEIERFSERKEVIYRAMYRPHLEPVRGLVRFLDLARARGKKLAVGSSARKGNIDFVLDGLQVRAYFDAIVGAADVREGKPSPEMFLKCAALLGLPRDQCLVFEDAQAGFEAAHRAGMKSIGIATDPAAHDRASHPGVLQVAADFEEVLSWSSGLG